jgi:O-antigen/teichoic acid export membrane protein
MSKSQVRSSTVYLYVENITGMLLGYVFWFLMSNLTTPEIIGVSSSLTSLTAIYAAIGSIGIPLTVHRLMGNMYFERKFADIRVLLEVSLIIMSIGLSGCSIFIVVTKSWLLYSLDFSLIVVSLFLLTSTAISTLFRYIVIASLKTRKLFLISIFSIIVKITVAIILVLEGAGVLGVIVGYTITPILTSILLVFSIREFFNQSGSKPIINFTRYSRKLISATMASWIPLAVDTLGAQLGTIVVLGFQGAGNAGFYFISFQIFMAIAAVISTIESTTYPALSSMDINERKRFSWRLIKIGLIVTLPLSYAIIFYSNDIMKLFGESYIEGSLALQILMTSVIPTTMIAGITTLLYSYEKYRTILAIDLATSITRTLFYFILVPLYGANGAALSFVLGSFIGLSISIVIFKKLGVPILWKDLALMNIIAAGAGLILLSTGLNFVIGIILSMFISYVLFLKFQILCRNDVEDFFEVLPPRVGNPIIRTINIIGKKLNQSY